MYKSVHFCVKGNILKENNLNLNLNNLKQNIYSKRLASKLPYPWYLQEEYDRQEEEYWRRRQGDRRRRKQEKERRRRRRQEEERQAEEDHPCCWF